MITVGMDVDRIPFCCGVREAGNFHRFEYDPNDEDIDEYMGYLEGGVRYSASHDDPTEAYKACLRKMLKGYNEHDDWTHKKIIQFWFVKPQRFVSSVNGVRPDDAFCNEELRQIVMALPGVQKIGEAYVNPNSNNIIEGYYIFNSGEITIE